MQGIAGKAEELLEMIKIIYFNDQEESKDLAFLEGLIAEEFVYETEPRGSQWNTFVMVFSWLSAIATKGENGVSLAGIDQWDDPTNTINQMILVLNSLKLPSNFSSSLLRAGYGESIVNMLHSLAKTVLAKNNFALAAPVLEVQKELEEIISSDDDNDIGSDGESSHVAEELDETSMQSREAFERGSDTELKDTRSNLSVKSKHAIGKEESEWRQEVESITPSLRKTVGVTLSVSQGTQWRLHLLEAKNREIRIREQVNESHHNLLSLGAGVEKDLRHLERCQKGLTGNYAEFSARWQTTREKLAGVEEREKKLNDEVLRLGTESNNLNEELSELKEVTADKGNLISDTKPLQQLRHSREKLRDEIRMMNVQLNVVRHEILKCRLREKTEAQRQRKRYW